MHDYISNAPCKSAARPDAYLAKTDLPSLRDDAITRASREYIQKCKDNSAPRCWFYDENNVAYCWNSSYTPSFSIFGFVQRP